jgi:hypothetical protein
MAAAACTSSIAACTVGLKPDHALGDGTGVVLHAAANAADGSISWEGEGIDPGSAEFHALKPGVSTRVDVVIRVADGRAPRTEPPLRDLSVRIEGPDGSPAGKTDLLRYGGGHPSIWFTHPGGTTRVSVAGSGFLLASKGDEVSAPVRFAEGEAPSEVVLRLQRGGNLAIRTDADLPPSLAGGLVVRRLDGVPLVTEAMGLGCFGPLLPGDVALVIELCGERVGEMRATIVAGETTTVRLPR